MSETPIYNFKAKGRIPVVPLSIEYRDIAEAKELIVDYTNGDIFIVTANGQTVNVCASESTMNTFVTYLQDNPSVVENLMISAPDGSTKSLTETLNSMYTLIDGLANRNFNYAGSSTEGGPATSANKVNSTLTIKESGSTKAFNGSTNVTVDLTKYIQKGANLTLSGALTLQNKLFVTRNAMYGNTLPTSGSEGQLFFLITE